MSALAAMKVIQQLCAAFCVYVASLGPFHRGAAFIFMEVAMGASQYVLICDDGEVVKFGHLSEARAWAADLAAEGTTAHLYTHINTFEAEAVDLFDYNGVEPGRDFPATLHA